MNSARDVEQVSDVLGASASRAWGSESCVVQAREGSVPSAFRRSRGGKPGSGHSEQACRGQKSGGAPGPNVCPLARQR